MTNEFIGVIIEESLENKDVLKKIKILKTKVEKVTKNHQTSHLKKWTLHSVEIPENKAREISRELCKNIYDMWYGDFKNDKYHYIIFRNKIFKINRRRQEQYDKARKYGISLGIPEYQVDFHPDTKEWKR